MILTDLYIASIAIAFGSCLINFHQHTKQLKALTYIIGLDLFGEILGFYLYGIFKTNLPVYNIILLLEFVGYSYFFSIVFKKKLFKKIAFVSMLAFPIFWISFVFIVFNFLDWNSYVFVLGSLLMVIFSVLFYSELLKDLEVRTLKDIAEFWIVTGLLIFYTLNLPFLGMYNFLIKNFPGLADSMSVILRVLNIVMYSLFTYAYVCQARINFRKLH